MLKTSSDTKKENALVIFPILAGIKDIEYSLSEEGEDHFLIAEFTWLTGMCDTTKIFSQGGVMVVEKFHPKVIAVENALKNVRKSIGDVPLTRNKYHIVGKVKKDMKSWSKPF